MPRPPAVSSLTEPSDPRSPTNPHPSLPLKVIHRRFRQADLVDEHDGKPLQGKQLADLDQYEA